MTMPSTSLAANEGRTPNEISIHPNLDDIGKGSLYRSGYQCAQIEIAADVASLITKHAWSTIVWEDGRRSQGGFLSSAWLALDFDNPHFTLQNAVENIFCDCIHVIGTTKSHRQKKGGIVCDRFRVVLKLEKEITDINTYRATAARHIYHWDADSQCKDGARFFWPCVDIVSVQEEGEVIEVIKGKKRKAYVSPYKKQGILPPWAIRNLETIIPEGRRNNTCYGLGHDLAAAGFDLEKSIDLVLKSETYRGITNPSLIREIENAVTNGWKKEVERMSCQGRSLKN